MNKKLVLRISAIVAGLAGLVILGATLYPIASYEIESRQKYPRLISPISQVKGNSVTLESVDYTRASNWFVGESDQGANFNSSVDYYTVSIPKLEIENASVKIGGEDLSQNLIHYSGTNAPGKIGNSVVFGHSILPQFYDPEDYLAIFSTLPTLEEGDQIIVGYDGVTYTYEVESMFEVLPTDLEVLDQNENNSYLSLITCTPPGHPLKPKRLIVRAKIVPPNI